METDKLISELYATLEMIRDADDDCKKEGLPSMPHAARARVDAALSRPVAEYLDELEICVDRVRLIAKQKLAIEMAYPKDADWQTCYESCVRAARHVIVALEIDP